MFYMAPAFELGVMPMGGGYPVGFVEFVGGLMGVTDYAKVLHLCSGSIRAPLTVDMRAESECSVRGDVRRLPVRSSSVDFVMADPPFGPEYATEMWGLGKQYPAPIVLLREAARVLRPGGKVAYFDFLVPLLPPELERIGCWGVSIGPGYRIRALTIAVRSIDTVLA